ncbi:MAG: CHAT domain-containing protein [Bacteroidetes bacterium]|nr:CHAT domain-containing protein [Bacteroidota bacterium]
MIAENRTSSPPCSRNADSTPSRSARAVAGDAAYSERLKSLRSAPAAAVTPDSLRAAEATEENLRAAGGPPQSLAGNLLEFGYMCMKQGHYVQAVHVFDSSLALYRSRYKPRNREAHAVALLGSAQARVARGDWNGAARSFAEAIGMLRRLYPGEDNLDLADAIASYGNFHRLRGEYEAAEPMLREALAMFGRIDTCNSDPRHAACLEGLAAYERERGDPAAARAYALQALSVRRNISGGLPDRELAASMRALGAIVESTGDTAGALEQYTTACSMLRTLDGSEPGFDLAGALGDLGRLYAERGELRRALPVLDEATGLYRRLCGGAPHPEYANCILSAALCRGLLGGRSEAARQIDSAAAMYHRLYRRLGHLELAIAMDNVARAAERLGMEQRAEEAYEEVLGLLPRVARESGLFEGEARQLRFNRRIASTWNHLLNHLGRTRRPERLYNAALGFKEHVLAAVQWRNSVLAELDGKDPAAADLLRRYVAARRAFASVPPAAASADFGEWYREHEAQGAMIERMEDSLARFSSAFGTNRQRTTWRGVQRALRHGERMVEFLRLPYIAAASGDDSVVYCALVLAPGRKEPAFAGLCDERRLLGLLKVPVGDPRQESGSYIHDAERGEELYNQVWAPIDLLLHGADSIFLSVDGQLNRVAFGALRNPDGELLLGRYHLHYLYSSHDLVPPPRLASEVHRGPGTAAVFGDPRYDADSLELWRTRVGPVPPDSSGRGGAGREPQLELPREAGVGDSLPRLSASAQEVRDVAAILRRHAFRVDRSTDIEATEEAFERLRSPTVLHVATHGFFFSDPMCPRDELIARQSAGGASALRYAENPLLRSGLLFAGADRAWTLHAPAEGIADGIVTAYDVAHMNLSGTQLVVLSACETGLGDIMVGEGVFGLKRAFRAAGARAVMMSLWKVPDKQTAELMRLFYANWLDRGMTKPAALVAAQREMAGKYGDPYYWAAFVLVGE